MLHFVLVYKSLEFCIIQIFNCFTLDHCIEEKLFKTEIMNDHVITELFVVITEILLIGNSIGQLVHHLDVFITRCIFLRYFGRNHRSLIFYRLSPTGRKSIPNFTIVSTNSPRMLSIRSLQGCWCYSTPQHFRNLPIRSFICILHQQKEYENHHDISPISASGL